MYKNIPSELYTAVFEAVGKASVCWTEYEKAGVFQSEKAEIIALEILDKVSPLLASNVTLKTKFMECLAKAEALGFPNYVTIISGANANPIEIEEVFDDGLRMQGAFFGFYVPFGAIIEEQLPKLKARKEQMNAFKQKESE